MKIMAIDLGDVRTGLAVCDKFEILAFPLMVIEEINLDKVIDIIVREVDNNTIEKVIVGYPKKTNGSIGERAKKSELLVNKLEKFLNKIPIILWDERYSTKTANDLLVERKINARKRKKMIDAVAATIILESYLKFQEQRNI